MVCAHFMCDGVNPLDPTSWREECATGSCDDCPKPSFAVPPNQEERSVTYSTWTSKKVDGRRKFALYNVSQPIQQLADELPSDLVAIKRHVYTAAVTWAKCRQSKSQLRPGAIVTVEDYQRNIEFKAVAENPTALAFSANSEPLACYPIGVDFVMPGEEEVKTGAMVFISADTRHDHQQVQAMERR